MESCRSLASSEWQLTPSASACGNWVFALLSARSGESAAGGTGTRVKLLAVGSGAGLLLGIVASRVLALIVYQATPRDPLVLASVIVSMALLGVIATWIPARRAFPSIRCAYCAKIRLLQRVR